MRIEGCYGGVVGLLLLWNIGAAAATNGDHEVRVAFTKSLFLGSDIIDVRASSQVWVDSIVRDYEVGKAGPVLIYEQVDRLEQGVASKQFDLCYLLTSEYLKLKNRKELEPLFVPQIMGRTNSELLLLVPRNREIYSVDQLRGKRVNLSHSRFLTLEKLWLDQLLLEAGIKEDRASFFASIREPTSPTSVVLPVFFGKVDACLISRRRYELMVELNPQVGQKLIALAVSEPLTHSLICFRKGIDPELSRKMRWAVTDLHTSIEGEQLLMNFQIDQFVPFVPELLHPVERLMRSQGVETRSLSTRLEE